jgi:hypothetical protein
MNKSIGGFLQAQQATNGIIKTCSRISLLSRWRRSYKRTENNIRLQCVGIEPERPESLQRAQNVKYVQKSYSADIETGRY